MNLVPELDFIYSGVSNDDRNATKRLQGCYNRRHTPCRNQRFNLVGQPVNAIRNVLSSSCHVNI